LSSRCHKSTQIIMTILGLPILVIVIFLGIKSIFALRSRRFQTALYLGILPAVFGLLVIVGWACSPTKLSRSDILGEYVIDRSRFPGLNADWQHSVYTLVITENELILRDRRTSTVWTEPIKWAVGPEYLWSFKNQNSHHILAGGPTLFRESFSHYYVFNSKLYGNVFFCKKGFFE